MRWLRKLFSSPSVGSSHQPTQPAPVLQGVTITRGGKEIEADEVFAAANSQDLPRMLAAAELQTHPVDRHFLLQNIVGLAYKNRKDPRSRHLCIDYAQLHISEFPAIKPHLAKEMGGTLARVSTFQKLATVFTEDRRFAEAIAVCEQALSFGLNDGTQSGFEGRITRIRKISENKPPHPTA
ncbi:MAG: hypothetical protein EOP84_06780 [Verrucomicrobiaceae bacterium]|nr:MAG: hypothetical protein EOP84_06780 [Verrucomicrobiaceae bacterium]